MRRLLVALLAGLFATSAVAQTSTVTANQGRPGAYGSWPVRQLGVAGTATNTSGRNAARPTATTTVVSSNATPCTAAGGASCTIIYASTDWLQWSNITITIRNSGANALTNVLVEWSPDGTNFEVWDPTTFAALASSASLSLAIAGNSRRFLRIEARSALGATAVVSITANDG